jgi:hypothetical protein
MFLASTQLHQHAFVDHSAPQPGPSGSHQVGNPGPGTTASTLLPAHRSSMERSAPEYSQSGLPSPYPSNLGDTPSETSSVDHASAAATAPYAPQEVRSNNYSTSATPTSDYGVYPPSARSASFPEHIQRSYHPASNHSGSSGGMAQTPTSPSMSLPDGCSHQNPHPLRSDHQVPIDPSIAAPSPTYGHGQYSPYAPPPTDMSHGYQHPGSAGLYHQNRPDWTGYGAQHGGQMTPGVFPSTPTSAPPQARPNQVGHTPKYAPCFFRFSPEKKNVSTCLFGLGGTPGAKVTKTMRRYLGEGGRYASTPSTTYRMLGSRRHPRRVLVYFGRLVRC